MSAVRAMPPALPASPSGEHICHCDGFSALIGRGFSETAELALWRRDTPAGTGPLFRRLDYSRVRDLRVEGDGDEILAAAGVFLAGLDWPHEAARLILSDIGAMVACTADHEVRFGLRLEYETGDACRRFHKDKTDLRLITTYRGRGTQWIDTATGEDAPAIQEMGTLHVGMFLGERAGRPGHVFHRSPPVAQSGDARFLMVLDIERCPRTESPPCGRHQPPG